MKVVPSYSTPEAGIRCHVKLLDLYLSKIPPEKDVIYLHPVAKKPTDPAPVAPLYIAVPYGKEVLRKMVPDMCQVAGFSKRTNHISLRATRVTEMLQSPYRAGQGICHSKP